MCCPPSIGSDGPRRTPGATGAECASNGSSTILPIRIRTGRPGETPLRLNDRLLITYRLQTPKPRAYVALEDELPAGLETANPELPLFAPFYDLPPTPAGQREASLSSSELRDHATLLYFDRLEPGVSVYSVLARASAAGSFRWPATQAGPMYDPAVGGLAPSEQLVVTGD